VEAFNQKPEIIQFLLGNFRLNRRTAIQGSVHTADKLVAASEWIANLVKGLYNREVDEVIYPPISLDSYSPDKENPNTGSFYLYLGRIDELHRTEEAIRAFNELPFTLKVAGDGPELGHYKRIVEENIEFCGYVTGEEKYELLASAKGLVVPTPHSFGRVIVEALASGTPVIALDEQFAPYILSNNETGLLYERGSQNLRQAISEFEGQSWDESLVMAKGSEYSISKTKHKWNELIYD